MSRALSSCPPPTALVPAPALSGRIAVSYGQISRRSTAISNALPGYSVRESIPQQIPDRPPYTAHLGNLSYDATVETVTELFEGCDVASVRIIEDREMQRPKGFGYVEFATVEGLKKALTLDNESFQGRMIKIKVADPRKCSALTCCRNCSFSHNV